MRWERWLRWSLADKRGQVVKLGNITVINDCYNSNPTALNAMVDALAAMPAKRRIVVAGEMLELGPAGEAMHRQSGEHIAAKKVDVLLGVRGQARAMVEAARASGMSAEFVATPEEAGEWLARETRDGDVVLLKASRGVKLEKALEKLSAVGLRHQLNQKRRPTTTTDDRPELNRRLIALLAVVPEAFSLLSAVSNFSIFNFPHRIRQSHCILYRSDHRSSGH